MSKSHEIVYNNCYGGYGISAEGLKILQQNSPADSIWNSNGIETDGEYVYLSEVLEQKSRTDKYLIAAIKEYGSEVISGECAKLRVYESCSRVVRINVYDGRESVEEVDMDDVIVID